MAGKFGVLWGRRKGGNECYRSDRHAALPLDLISYHSSIYIPVCVLSCFSRVRLCDPVDCSPPSSSVRGILQARILEWVAISFSGDLPDPGIEPRSPTLQADTLTSVPPGKEEAPKFSNQLTLMWDTEKRVKVSLKCVSIKHQKNGVRILIAIP